MSASVHSNDRVDGSSAGDGDSRYESLTVRVPDFSFSGAGDAHRWFAKNAYCTQFLNSIAIILPVIEKVMIQEVRYHLERISNPDLSAHLQDFIRQEAQHSRAHVGMNDWLRDSGLDVDAELKRYEKTINRIRKIFGRKNTLAACVFLEHMTWAFSRMILKSDKIVAALDSPVRELLVWHCMEEIEHRSSLYDLYTEVGGGHRRRIVMGVVMLGVAGKTFSGRMKRLTDQIGPGQQEREDYTRLQKEFVDYPQFNQDMNSFFRMSYQPHDEDVKSLHTRWSDIINNATVLSSATTM